MSDRQHTTSHEIERYAGLFAKRTYQMRSSAMRDLMAITARPDVISLAGGLPDTSTFPPETFATLMTQIANESCASALQYGPTEGFDETSGGRDRDLRIPVTVHDRWVREHLRQQVEATEVRG